jgi:dsDNA-specific endonuclease/ATPase MutS2
MKTSLNNLYHQGEDWLRELKFYEDELSLLSKRLEETSGNETSNKEKAESAEFLKRFVTLRENLDGLREDITARNHRIVELAKQRPQHVEEEHLATGPKILQRMKTFSQSIADTRYQFNAFLAKKYWGDKVPFMSV